MTLVVVGMNHNSAPLEVREKVAVAAEQLEDALRHAVEVGGLTEVVLLSTCNRTEVFAISEASAEQEECRALRWLAAYHHLTDSEVERHCYRHSDSDAMRHMIEVSAGLDSMVLGEPQIFGQIKSALSVAETAGTVGSHLSRTMQHCFSVAKKVRTDTAIGENPVSVAYAAVDLSKHIFSSLEGTSALLIGAGETIELVASHLHQNGVSRLVVANRTMGRASELAQKFGAQAVLLPEIPRQLEDADIVISSTGSQLPILGKGAVESALKKRRHRPIFMVDIAVPRDIEPEVGELADVYLYSVDDLRGIVEENKLSRQSEVCKADEIVAEGVVNYEERTRSQSVVGTLRAFRSQAEQTRDEEVQRALKRLQAGENAEAVIAELGRSLTNKLIHPPSVAVKQAGAEGRQDVINIVTELYKISGHNDNSEN
ncbi:MAG: glutamyl-tRNA reductase [Pseudomonadales bacterium]